MNIIFAMNLAMSLFQITITINTSISISISIYEPRENNIYSDYLHTRSI